MSEAHCAVTVRRRATLDAGFGEHAEMKRRNALRSLRPTGVTLRDPSLCSPPALDRDKIDATAGTADRVARGYASGNLVRCGFAK